MNPKIGIRNANGTIKSYPSQSLSGRPLSFTGGPKQTPPAIVHNLSATEFAIGDVTPPKGFDVQAAVDALRKPSAESAKPKSSTSSAAPEAK